MQELSLKKWFIFFKIGYPKGFVYSFDKYFYIFWLWLQDVLIDPTTSKTTNGVISL